MQGADVPPTYLSAPARLAFSWDTLDDWVQRRARLLTAVSLAGDDAAERGGEQGPGRQQTLYYRLLVEYAAVFTLGGVGGAWGRRRSEETRDARALDAAAFLLLHLAAAGDEDLFRRHLEREAQLFLLRTCGSKLAPAAFLAEAQRIIGTGIREADRAELPVEVAERTAPDERVFVIDDFLRVPFLVSFQQRLVAPVHGRLFLRASQLARAVATLVQQAHGSAAAIEKARALRGALERQGMGALLTRAEATLRGQQATVPTLQAGTFTRETILPQGARCFPPCAQRLLQHFKQDSHLRHMGRQQLTLFLKGLGVSFDEANAFLGNIFATRFTRDGYVRRYQYNVAHCYGLVGRRHDYPAFSCATILRFPTSAGEYHGCPFYAMAPEPLLAWLRTLYGGRVDAAAIETIRQVNPAHCPEVACRELFNAIFPGHTRLDVLHHPTAWVHEALVALGELPDVEDAA